MLGIVRGRSSRARCARPREGSRFCVTGPLCRWHGRSRVSAPCPGQTLSVAVLGAGHGGLALAGYLSRAGHRVALWNRSAHRTGAVAVLGGVCLTMPGSAAAVEQIAVATDDMAAVLSNASVVLVAVPASAHADVARRCGRYLRDGQTVLLLPGRTGGALAFLRVLRECGYRADIVLGEASSFPCAARTIAPAEAVIHGVKAELLAAAVPALQTEELVTRCRAVLPALTPARSVLHTGLSNVGAILHPTIALLNADRITSGETFDFYTEGVTRRVAHVLAAADEERLRIADAYGEQVQSLTSWIDSAYGHRADTLERAVAGNPAYKGIRAPSTIHHRYLLEDVPTGLIPLIELGAAARLAVPTLRFLVARAESALGMNLHEEARSLASLGLNGHSVAGIRSVVGSGFTRQSRRPAKSVVRFRRRNGFDGVLASGSQKTRVVA